VDPYLTKLIAPTTPKEPPQTVDPRSLPVYQCNRGGRRFFLIKAKLSTEQMSRLRSSMNLLRIEQQMSPEEYADTRRAADAAVADRRRDGTS
jgi:hypothetical protein